LFWGELQLLDHGRTDLRVLGHNGTKTLNESTGGGFSPGKLELLFLMCYSFVLGSTSEGWEGVFLKCPVAVLEGARETLLLLVTKLRELDVSPRPAAVIACVTSVKRAEDTAAARNHGPMDIEALFHDLLLGHFLSTTLDEESFIGMVRGPLRGHVKGTVLAETHPTFFGIVEALHR
jgi:hypothetical protein